MYNIWAIFNREFKNYFITPIAYVFIAIFLLMNGIFTFYVGSFFQRGIADLVPFFSSHPWIYMIFIPAITMRLWAEEKKQGTEELLFTLPITTIQAIIAKLLAAWCFIIIALLLTFPMVFAVNYLGNPDNGVILAGYLGSALMAGAFIAIGSCISATTSNQVIAFVGSFLVSMLFNVTGFPMVIDYLSKILPGNMIEIIQGFSFVTNFDVIIKGLLDVKVLVYFASIMLAWMVANVIILEINKARN
jgi:ABC-2 type transport system permease protein